MNHKIIKNFKERLKKTENEAEILKIEISNKQKERALKLDQINNLKQKIKNLSKKNNTVEVSDHAIVRYFERVKGVDIDSLKKEIVTEDLLKMVDKLGGAGKYPVKDFTVIMKDNTIITIVN